MPKTEGLITKNELRLLLSFSIVIVIWSILVITVFMNQAWFYNAIPPVQYILFNGGIMALIVVAVGLPVSISINKLKKKNKSNKYWEALKIGLSLWGGFGISLELILGPYFIDLAGKTTIYAPQSMSQTTIDVTIVYFLRIIGTPASWQWWIVYVVTPIIVVFAIILAFTWNTIVKKLDGV